VLSTAPHGAVDGLREATGGLAGSGLQRSWPNADPEGVLLPGCLLNLNDFFEESVKLFKKYLDVRVRGATLGSFT
jgi:hypothetical protein